MGFSGNARAELARLFPTRPCCRLAEMAGMALDELGAAGFSLNLGSAAVARKALVLLKSACPVKPRLTVEQRRRLHRYKIEVRGFPGIAEADAVGLPTRRCCRRAFLRGAFLAHGSITTPDRTYHLEIAVATRPAADRLAAVFAALGVRALIASKRRGFVVYVKDSEQIGEFLRLVEAHQAVLKLENIRIVKAMKNQVNRLVNAETANMDKTVAASMQQVAGITYLAEKVGLESLPPRLRTVARARLEAPYASLAELGDSLEPRLSKSAVNYRLRRLLAIAAQHGFTGA